MSALPMHPTERDRERFRDAARQHLTWCDFNRTGIDGDYKDAETRYLFKMWWSVERERQLLQNLNMSQGCKLSELAQKLEKDEAELARLKNQKAVAEVRLDEQNLKFTWLSPTIGTGTYSLFLAPCYAVTGPAVAAPSVPEEWREVLSGLLAIAEKKGKKQGSPNHGHLRPGIWDDDNGPVLSGKPCAECAMYDKARALLQSTPQSGSEPVAHHPV